VLDYTQMSLFAGGPWIGALAVPGQEQGRMTSYQDIVDRLEQSPAIKNLVITGGEPLMHPDLLDILRAAKQNGYDRIMLRTTGRRFVDLKFLEHIIDAGAHKFEIMPFTRPEGNDAFSSKLIRDNIRGLRAMRRMSTLISDSFQFLYIALVVPVCRDNYLYLPDIVQTILDSVHVDRVIFCWGDPGFSIWQAEQAVGEAIDRCIRRRIWAVTRGIPICAIPRKTHHLEEIFINPDEQQKLSLPELCRECCFDRICASMHGISAVYTMTVKPFSSHPFAPQMNDVFDKGHVFDESNAPLYER